MSNVKELWCICENKIFLFFLAKILLKNLYIEDNNVEILTPYGTMYDFCLWS